MRLKYALPIAAVVAIPAVVLWLSTPARAVTETPTRKALEQAFFSEHLIKSSIYPKSRHDIYVKEKRSYARGINVQQKLIYEPDVYTWELAMAAHRKQMAENPPETAMPAPEGVVPFPMTPPAISPVSPSQVQLIPLTSERGGAVLPADADSKMERILTRAEKAGLNPNSQLKADQIKQRLIEHMNSLNIQKPAATDMPSAPSVPVISRPLPKGTPADSFDPTY